MQNEKPKGRIDHDHLFKELLQDFFEEFIALFFPNIYEEVDFAHLKFLDKELFNDTQRRKSREVDIAVETKLKDEGGLILIHVEQQAQYEDDFNERMFLYFSRLLEEHPGTRIIPIALFSYEDQHKHEPNTYEMNFPFLDVLKFNYLTVELKKLNWRDFIRQDNPVAGALTSKMGYTEGEEVEVKKEFLRMLVRLELDPARNHELTTFFETYLTLTDEEEDILQEEVSHLNADEEAKVMELMTSYERKGNIEGRLDTICTYLESRFGKDSEALQSEIRSINDLERLDQVTKKLFTAVSLEDAEKIVRAIK